MFRSGICIYLAVLFVLFGCVKENVRETAVLEHEYFVSSGLFIHPSFILVELQPDISKIDKGEYFYLGPVCIQEGCDDVRCGIYHRPLSVESFYPVSPETVMRVDDDTQIYSIEVKHSSPDTLFLEVAFSHVEEGNDRLEITNGNMRLPFIRGRGCLYRCIIDGLPLQSVSLPRSGIQRFFVDMNSLFM